MSTRTSSSPYQERTDNEESISQTKDSAKEKPKLLGK